MVAGLYDVWVDKADMSKAPITSHIVLTMDASSNISTIHHRMPVLLTPNAAAIWLNTKKYPVSFVHSLLQTY